MKLKVRLKHLRYLLLVPAVVAAFWFAGFAGFMAQLALAGAPPGAFPPMIVAFLQDTAQPIVAGRAQLGFVMWEYPEAHTVYRERREGLLERVARSQPDRRVIAVIALDRLYAPEEVEAIVDPAKMNVVGFAAFAPGEAFGRRGGPAWGQTSGGGLSLTSVPRWGIPSDFASASRVVERWPDIRTDWEESIASRQDEAARKQKELEILKAGEIPPVQMFTYVDGQMINLAEDPRLLGMTPSERLQDEHFLAWMASQEEVVSGSKADARWARERWQKEMGIYSVTVEGPAAQINELRRRPGIVLVDPMLFPGILGTISTGGSHLVIDFAPTLPIQPLGGR